MRGGKNRKYILYKKGPGGGGFVPERSRLKPRQMQFFLLLRTQIKMANGHAGEENIDIHQQRFENHDKWTKSICRRRRCAGGQ